VLRKKLFRPKEKDGMEGEEEGGGGVGGRDQGELVRGSKRKGKGLCSLEQSVWGGGRSSFERDAVE